MYEYALKHVKFTQKRYEVDLPLCLHSEKYSEKSGFSKNAVANM